MDNCSFCSKSDREILNYFIMTKHDYCTEGRERFVQCGEACHTAGSQDGRVGRARLQGTVAA